MWTRILLASCAGSVFFAVVPTYAPPVVLQWEGIPAAVGVALAGSARDTVARLRRSRGTP